MLTATILLGWTLYVVSLSQGGKAPLEAIGDAVHAIGDAKPALVQGENIGIVKAMLGGEYWFTSLGARAEGGH